ncbi:lymphotoxin-beta [Gastrophryne carolinensis]
MAPLQETMRWTSDTEEAFLKNVTHSPLTTLVTQRKGLYYIYCQVGFVGRVTNVMLFTEVLTFHQSVNDNITLFVGSGSVPGPPPKHAFWSTSLSQGGLAELRAGQKLYVHVNHPELVDYSHGKTFFGLVMLS